MHRHNGLSFQFPFLNFCEYYEFIQEMIILCYCSPFPTFASSGVTTHVGWLAITGHRCQVLADIIPVSESFSLSNSLGSCVNGSGDASGSVTWGSI